MSRKKKYSMTPHERYNAIEQYHLKLADPRCVVCGKEARHGSMKHPYCESHFQQVWNNDYLAYWDWLERTHA